MRVPDLMDGCRILCGLCEIEIGDQPLDEHYETCKFVNADWSAGERLVALMEKLVDARP